MRRMAARGFLALSLLAAAVPALAQRAEPSTPAERARVVQLTHRLEAEPLGPEARAAQIWLVNWIREVPDVTVSVCDLMELPPEDRYPWSPTLLVQMMAGNAAFQIENPRRAGDDVAVQGAALKSALKAYSAILKRKPAARLAAYDRLVAEMNDGRLERRLKALVPQRCTQAPPDGGEVI
ncbi:MAG TPA: hypothetical protein VFA75_17350 [Nevskia sp.]|jgi:hypothetical protein|nr:hypothetical protein [Nevskia sp.]